MMSHPKRRTSYVSVSDSDMEEEDSIINSSLVHHNQQRPNQDNGSNGIDILLFASQLSSSSQLSSVNTGDTNASSRLPATAAVCTELPLKGTVSRSCVSFNDTANTTSTTTTSMYQKMMTNRLTSMNNANEASKQSSNLLLSSANSMFINSVLSASKKSKSTRHNNHQKDQIKIDLLEQHIRKKLMEKIQRKQLIHKNRLLMNQQADDIQKYHQKYGAIYRRALLERQIQIRSETIQLLRGQLNK